MSDVDLGARARQIRDDLLAQSKFAPQDMLAIQLDDRAVFLGKWRDLLLATLDLPAMSRVKEAGEMRRLVQNWGGRAAVESAGYRLVRGFRNVSMELALAPITDRCRKIDPEFEFPTRQVEQSVWILFNQKPMHLLNPAFKSYDDLLVAAVGRLVAELRSQGLSPTDATWGKRNRVMVRHPLSQGIPVVGRWLDIEPQELPGDSHMPRFQAPAAGASERIAVSPGHEEQGLFHMPGGQSGHFLSEYYTKGHEAWALGKPTPFLPGKAHAYSDTRAVTKARRRCQRDSQTVLFLGRALCGLSECGGHATALCSPAMPAAPEHRECKGRRHGRRIQSGGMATALRKAAQNAAEW